MAFGDVKKVRLGVSDPIGYNDFISIPADGDLPTENIPPQTAYSIQDLKIYKAYSAEQSTWEIVSTELTDERIQFFIDAHGVDKARWHCLKAILVIVGRRIALERMRSGADEFSFIALKDLYAFYKNLLDDIADYLDPPCEAGAWISTPQPVIGGGI